MLFNEGSKLSAGLLAALAIGFAGTSANAQTVTVNAANGSPNGTTTFNKVSTAIASFAVGGTNAADPAPNIINVAAATPVIDKVVFDADPTGINPVVITGDITIQGTGGRGVLAGQLISNAEQNIRISTASPVDPAFAWRQPVNLTLKNMALIPAEANMFCLLLVKSMSTAGVHSIVSLEDCVLTANNGSNLPLTTTGADDPDVTAAGVIALRAGGDGIYGLSRLERGDMTINLTRTVIASFSSGGSSSNNSDCVLAFMNGTATDLINTFVNVNEGCVFANANRGIQATYGTYVNVNGTHASPVVFRKLTGNGIWNYSDTTVQPTATSVNHAHFYELGGSALTEALARAFIASINNSVIATIPTADGVNLFGNGALPPAGEATGTLTINNSVFHNTGAGTTPGNIYAAGSFNRTVEITNSVFTGAGTQYGIVNNSTTGGTFNVSDSVFSLAGPNALLGATTGPGTTNLGSGITNGEVNYVNMTNPFAANFFEQGTSDVRDWSVF